MSAIKMNLQRLKILDQEKKKLLVEKLFFHNSKDINDKKKKKKSDSEEGNRSSEGNESEEIKGYGIDEETYESIYRIEEDVADLKNMFNVMMSNAQRMTDRIERKLSKVAAK
jgi:hypothetical protein